MNGIDPNIKNDRGQTALHWAVEMNKPRSIEALRTLPMVDWNLRTNEGFYPLTSAVQYGYTDILQTILSVPQLDLSVTTPRGRNVAQIAVEGGEGDRQRVVEILSQDRRVNWNIKNSDGDTPLMFCLKYNITEKALTVLNNANINLGIKDRSGRYHEDIAR